VGAHVHSAWLAPRSPVSQDQLVDLVRRSNVQVVPFGVPLGDAAARAATPSTIAAWLDKLGDLPAIAELNTFALPKDQQTEQGIRALFRTVAPVLAAHGNVILVAGANEPLTAGKGWPSPEAAEARVRLEHSLWHEVSTIPFCHKLTPPTVDVAGIDWARIEGLWRDAQDAICYDWFEGNKDPLTTFDRLREVGDRFGKPVHVLETAVPRQDPATFARMKQGLASISLYQLLSEQDSGDAKFGVWLRTSDGFVQSAPATLLGAR
jgi:hypothetical protein